MKKQKIKRSGKVIRHFTVELCSDASLEVNSSNPYTLLNEEERLKDFEETFSVLLAETYRDANRNLSKNEKFSKYKVEC